MRHYLHFCDVIYFYLTSSNNKCFMKSKNITREITYSSKGTGKSRKACNTLIKWCVANVLIATREPVIVWLKATLRRLATMSWTIWWTYWQTNCISKYNYELPDFLQKSRTSTESTFKKGPPEPPSRWYKSRDLWKLFFSKSCTNKQNHLEYTNS